MYIYIYMYIFIYMHIYTHTHIHVFMYDLRVCVHVCMCVFVYMCMCVCVYVGKLIVYRWEAFFLISARIFSGMLLCMRCSELRCVQVLIRATMFLPPSLHSTLRSGKRERECVRESVCVSACEREREERERESERASEKKNEQAKRDWETHIHSYIRIHVRTSTLFNLFPYKNRVHCRPQLNICETQKIEKFQKINKKFQAGPHPWGEKNADLSRIVYLLYRHTYHADIHPYT